MTASNPNAGDKIGSEKISVFSPPEVKVERRFSTKSTPETEKLLGQALRASTANNAKVALAPKKELKKTTATDTPKPSVVATTIVTGPRIKRAAVSGLRCYNCDPKEAELENRPPHHTMDCLWGCGHCGAKQGNDGSSSHKTILCPNKLREENQTGIKKMNDDQKNDMMHEDRRRMLGKLAEEQKVPFKKNRSTKDSKNMVKREVKEDDESSWKRDAREVSRHKASRVIRVE